MKPKAFFSLLLLVLLMSSHSLFSGEIQFLWSKSLDSGLVYDMELMPDNNFFIMSTTSGVQIRITESGELINALPFFAANLEFTPDSTKLITTNGNDKLIQMRNLNDFSLIKEYAIPFGTDSTDLNYYISYIGLKQIVVDPIRPLLYAIRERSGVTINDTHVNIRRILIYNYETMQEVGELTLPSDINSWIKLIAISKDGKYLASINEGESHIMVWDLNTRQKIRNFKLCGRFPNINSGQPDQIQFSEKNTENIYFSGTFPQTKENVIYDGLFTYSIIENKMIDSTFGVYPNWTYQGQYAFFDNEERAMTAGTKIYVINLKSKIIEQKILQDTIKTGVRAWSGKLIYSNCNRYFLGYSKSNYLSSAFNNTETSIHQPAADQVIFPNPTTSEVSFNRNCQTYEQFYSIYNETGQMITQEFNLNPDMTPIVLDFSHYPQGIYFIRYKCGSTFSVYKIIKQG